MNERNINTSDLNRIIQVITDNMSDVEAVYLFGTFGTEYQNKYSDIDIAVLTKNKKNDTNDLSVVSEKISSFTGRNVDMIDLREVNTVFCYEIINDSEVIYCSDLQAKEEFEMYVFSDYQALNSERKEILKQIHSTGRIF